MVVIPFTHACHDIVYSFTFPFYVFNFERYNQLLCSFCYIFSFFLIFIVSSHFVVLFIRRFFFGCCSFVIAVGLFCLPFAFNLLHVFDLVNFYFGSNCLWSVFRIIFSFYNNVYWCYCFLVIACFFFFYFVYHCLTH